MSLPRRPEVQALVHIRPVVEEFAPSFVPGPGYGLLCSVLTSRARGTTKCPESLCLSLALPPSGRRVPPPPRTLLLSLRSYRLMRQSRVALPYFGFWPRSWSLCRLLPAPAATGIIPTLSLRILPKMPEPIPRRFAECVCLVLPQHSSAFPIIRLGRLPASFCEHDFSRVGFRGCSYFVMFRPPRLLASQIALTAASSPAGQPRLFYIRTERAPLPSHASDMLSARLQAIGGTRTFISQDSQPCRLLRISPAAPRHSGIGVLSRTATLGLLSAFCCAQLLMPIVKKEIPTIKTIFIDVLLAH